MADITVTMVLDDRQFTDKLKNINIITDDFGKKSTKSFGDATKLIQALTDKLKDCNEQFAKFGQGIDKVVEGTAKMKSSTDGATDSIGKLSKGFESLASAIVGASLTGFIANAMASASSTERMSEAIGVSIDKYIQLSAAAVAAGKDQDAMGRMMLRMEATAQQANDGNMRLREGYKQLGISMEYLQQHSPDEVMYKIATSLNQVESSGKRAELVMQLLGRDAKTFDFEAFVKGFDEASKSTDNHTEAIKSAANAYRQIQFGIMQLKNNILELLKPLMDLIGDNASGFLGAKTTASAFMAILVGTSITAGIAAFRALAGSLGLVVGSLISAVTGMLGYQAATTTAVVATTELAASQMALNAAIAATYSGIVPLAVAEAEIATASAAMATSGAAATGIFARIGAMFTGLIGIFEGFGAAILGVVGIVGAPAWATLAALIAGIAAAVTAATIVWKAFGEEIKQIFVNSIKYISDFFNTLGDYLSTATNAFDKFTTKAANGLRELFGMKPNPETVDTLKRLGVTPGDAGAGRGKVNPETGQGGGTTSGPILHPELIKAEELKNQLDLLNQTNQRVRERLQLEAGLAGKGSEYSAAQLAQFDEDTKYNNERISMLGKIKVLKLQSANLPDHPDNSKEVEMLNTELGLLEKQHGAIGKLTAAKVGAQNAAAMELAFEETHLKVRENLAGIDAEINNMSMGFEAKRLDAVEKEIEKQVLLIEKKRQAQIGSNSLPEAEHLAIVEKVTAEYEKQKLKLQELFAEIRRIEDLKFIDSQNVKATEELLKLHGEIAQITMTDDERRVHSLKQQLELIALQEIARRNAALGPGKSIDADEQAKVRQEVLDANKDVIASTNDVIAQSRDFGKGWARAFNQYADDATNGAKMAQSAFGSFTSAMDTAINDFVTTGKMNFSNFAISVIQDLEKIAIKAAAMNFLKAGMSGMAGAGGIFGGIASLFGFADGGDPPVNQPSIVGERGPELFVPKSAGTIIPNVSGGMGGAVTNQYITNNISAIDAKGVAQLFYENRQTLFGTVEKARKELPMRQGQMI